MKKGKLGMLIALALGLALAGCASGPKLGDPSPLQDILNVLPAVPIAGNDLKFEFGGDTWIAKVNGKNYMAGSFASQDEDDGTLLNLKQTHLYSSEQKPGIGGDIGWIEASTTDISLLYQAGPPATLTVR